MATLERAALPVGEPMSPMSSRVHPPRCPLCSRPVDSEHRPFCSRRCADLDLGNWLSDVYKVPSLDRPTAEEEEELERLLRRLESAGGEPS
jgi:hypothetical protein